MGWTSNGYTVKQTVYRWAAYSNNNKWKNKPAWENTISVELA